MHAGFNAADREQVAEYVRVSLRCLLVDDNRDFLRVATLLLESDGLEVVGAASSVDDAIAQIERLRPEVALVDIKLGNESGFDLVRRLADRGTTASCPVILISTYAERDYADLIAASPALGFVSKPSLSGQSVIALLEDAAATSAADQGSTASEIRGT